MSDLKKNKFFYAALALAILVIAQIVGVARAAFTNPSDAPPFSTVGIPLDTSNVEQAKQGSLTIGELGSSVILDGVNGIVKFLTGQNTAAIRFNAETGTLQFANDGQNFLDFTTADIDPLWESMVSGAINPKEGRSVGIGTESPLGMLDVRGNSVFFRGRDDFSPTNVDIEGNVNVQSVTTRVIKEYSYAFLDAGNKRCPDISNCKYNAADPKFAWWQEAFPEEFLPGVKWEDVRMDSDILDSSKSCSDDSMVFRNCPEGVYASKDSATTMFAYDLDMPEVRDRNGDVVAYDLGFTKFERVLSEEAGGKITAKRAVIDTVDVSGNVVAGNIIVGGFLKASKGIRFGDGTVQTTKGFTNFSCRAVRKTGDKDSNTASCAADEFLTGGGCYINEVEDAGDDNIGFRPVDTSGDSLKTNDSTLGKRYKCTNDYKDDEDNTAWAICCKFQF